MLQQDWIIVNRCYVCHQANTLKMRHCWRTLLFRTLSFTLSITGGLGEENVAYSVGNRHRAVRRSSVKWRQLQK